MINNFGRNFFIVAKSFPRKQFGWKNVEKNFGRNFFLKNHFLKDSNVEKFFIKNFDENVFTGICFPLEILIENHNKKQNFPLLWLKIFVEIFLLLQNHFPENSFDEKNWKKPGSKTCFPKNYFLKDSNLEKFFIKIFDGSFLLEYVSL